MSIDPAEQAKIESGIEAAQYYAQGAAKQATKIQEGLEASQKATKSLTRLTTSVKFLGKYKHKQELIYI